MIQKLIYQALELDTEDENYKVHLRRKIDNIVRVAKKESIKEIVKDFETSLSKFR